MNFPVLLLSLSSLAITNIDAQISKPISSQLQDAEIASDAGGANGQSVDKPVTEAPGQIHPTKPADNAASGSSCTPDAITKLTVTGKTVLKGFDLDISCGTLQYETTVPNRQHVIISLANEQSSTDCSATPTFKADPKADYGSLIAVFAKAAFPIAAGKKGDVGTEFVLPQASKGTMTVVMKCNKGSSALLPRTVIVHFRDPSPLTASVGTLVSFFPKRVYGASTSQVSVNSNGVVVTQNSVAITSSAKVQFVPIAFLNIHLFGRERLQTYFEAGAGINPNGSKVDIEYFLGPAISKYGVYLSPGLHIARASGLTNGFTLGEIIPSGVTPPVSYYSTFRFAIALSYSPAIKSAN